MYVFVLLDGVGVWEGRRAGLYGDTTCCLRFKKAFFEFGYHIAEQWLNG